MAANDKKRKGEAKKKNNTKYLNNDRRRINKARKEANNLSENPNDKDGLARCLALNLAFIPKATVTKLNNAIAASKISLNYVG
jgi:hypothetical protein